MRFICDVIGHRHSPSDNEKIRQERVELACQGSDLRQFAFFIKKLYILKYTYK